MAQTIIPIQVIRRIEMPAERIYDAFLNPEKAAKFMFATENGKMIKAEIDPRVGGEFTFIDKRPTGEAEHYGTYLELTRPKRIVFEFAVQKGSAERDRIAIDIKPMPRGCEVTLTHDLKPQYAPYKEKVLDGWSTILGGLMQNA